MDIWRMIRGWLGTVGPGLNQTRHNFRMMKINEKMSIDGIILTVASVFVTVDQILTAAIILKLSVLWQFILTIFADDHSFHIPIRNRIYILLILKR